MNHSKFLSALNLGTIKLQTSNSANAAQFQLQNNLKVSTTYISPQTHSRNTAQVMFQSTPNSEVNSSRSSIDGPATPNVELSKEERFKNKPTQ